MTMTINRSVDNKYPTVWLSSENRVTDIPHGVSVKASELNNGTVLLDGSAIGRESSGICSVQKYAKALTGSTATDIKVNTLGNQFAVGDKIFSLLNGKHYAITAIVTDTATMIDTITVGTAIDAPLTNGGFIYENADVADGATGAALAVSPVALTGTPVNVDTTSNIHVDAWVIGAVKYGTVGTVILDALKTNYSQIAEI